MNERFDFRNCDAMELLASLPGKSADCVITDPPYGTTQLAWDDAPNWDALIPELLRVSRGAVCVFSQMPIACDVVAAAGDRYRYDIVWRKTLTQGFLDAARKPLRVHELILVLSEDWHGSYHPQMGRGEPYAIRANNRTGGWQYGGQNPAATVNGGWRYPTDVIDFASVKAGVFHPTQKPLELIRYLVRTYSDRGGVVIDPYAGSGTTGEACALEERRFVGSELDAGYYEKSLERVRFAYAQGRLFSVETINGKEGE